MQFLTRKRSAEETRDRHLKKLVEEAKQLLAEAERDRGELEQVDPSEGERREMLEQRIRSRLARSRELAEIAKGLAKSS